MMVKPVITTLNTMPKCCEPLRQLQVEEQPGDARLFMDTFQAWDAIAGELGMAGAAHPGVALAVAGTRGIGLIVDALRHAHCSYVSIKGNRKSEIDIQHVPSWRYLNVS